jgi:hypothetical protein
MSCTRKFKALALTALVGAVLMSGLLSGCGKSAVAAHADNIASAVNAEAVKSGKSTSEVIRAITFDPDIKIGSATFSSKGVVTGNDRDSLWVRAGDSCYLVTGYPAKDATSAWASCSLRTGATH